MRSQRFCDEIELERNTFFKQNIPVVFTMDEVCFSVENVDGSSINVESIAPKATSKCSQRIDETVG